MTEKTLPHVFIGKLSDKALRSFKELESEIFCDGILSKREKLILAVASAVAVGCDFCVKELSRKALKKGVKLEELIEAASVAAFVCGGSAFRRASLILDLEKHV